MDDADLIVAASDARSRAHAPYSRFAMGAAVVPSALELGGPDLRVVVADPDGESATSDVGTLLPAGPRKRRT